MRDDLRDLLTNSLPAVDEGPAEWARVEQRAAQLRRRRRTAALVAVAAGVALVIVMPGLFAQQPTDPPPVVGNSEEPRDDEPTSAAGVDLVEVRDADAPRPVAHVDAADGHSEIEAGTPDVLRASANGEPVDVPLAERIDRQQAPNLLVADPQDAGEVYYSATIGLSACLDDPSGCTVRHAVRHVNLGAGTDELLIEDAFSVAVHPDGTIATVLLTPADQPIGGPPTGHVAVRPPGGEWREWTSEMAGYHLLGWADGRLLAQVDTLTDTEGGDDVIVIEGPDTIRRLVPDADGRIHWIGTSPDGTRALVKQEASGCCEAALLLADIASGGVLDELPYEADGWLLHGQGAWLDNERAVIAVFDNQDSGIQQLQVADGQLLARPVRTLGERNQQEIYWMETSADGTLVLILGGADSGSEGFRASYATCDTTRWECHVQNVGMGPTSTYLTAHSFRGTHPGNQ